MAEKYACIRDKMYLPSCSGDPLLYEKIIWDYPGISSLYGDVSGNPMQTNIQKKMESISRRTLPHLVEKFISTLRKSGLFNINRSFILQKTSFYDTQIETGLTGYKGIQIREWRINRPLLTSIHLKEVELLFAHDGMVQLYITDGIRTEVRDVYFTKDILYTVAVDFESYTDHLYIYYDTTGLHPYRTNPDWDCGCEGKYWRLSEVRGLSIENGEYLHSSSTYGLNARYSYDCSLDKLVCMFASELADIWGYVISKSLIEDAYFDMTTIHSLTIDKEQLKEMSALLSSTIDERMETLSNSIKPALSTLGDPCIQCLKPHIRTVIP